jgi:hypothetical protein
MPGGQGEIAGSPTTNSAKNLAILNRRRCLGAGSSWGEGRIDFNRVAHDLKQAGVDEATVNKYRGYYERVRDNPGTAADVGREMSGDAGSRQVARQASLWSLAGMLVSLATVIFGSLVGSGELLQPVPILGVRRVPGDRRDRVT